MGSKIQEFLEELDSIKHILEVTFASLKDTRLLMQCILSLSDTYEGVLSYLAENGEEKKGFSEIVLKSKELKELSLGYKSGPKSFSRKEDYVVCAKNYKVQVISSTSVQEYLGALRKLLLIECE